MNSPLSRGVRKLPQQGRQNSPNAAKSVCLSD